MANAKNRLFKVSHADNESDLEKLLNKLHAEGHGIEYVTHWNFEYTVVSFPSKFPTNP